MSGMRVGLIWLLHAKDADGKKMESTRPFVKNVKKVHRLLNVLTLAWVIDDWWKNEREE